MAARGWEVGIHGATGMVGQQLVSRLAGAPWFRLAWVGARQRAERRWSGAVVTNPNWSTVFLAMVLAACRPFGPTRALVTTLQAASGAGYPGVPAWDLLGNVVPFIDGEDEKIETETRKILGTFSAGAVTAAPTVISAQATRVPVLDGIPLHVFSRTPGSGHVALVVDQLDLACATAALHERFFQRGDDAGTADDPGGAVDPFEAAATATRQEISA